MPPEILILQKVKSKSRFGRRTRAVDDLYEYQEGVWLTREELEQEQRRPRGIARLLENKPIRACVITIGMIFSLIAIGNISEWAEWLIGAIVLFLIMS